MMQRSDPLALTNAGESVGPPSTPTTASFVVLTSNGETTTQLPATIPPPPREVAGGTTGTAPTALRGSAAPKGLVASAPNLSRSHGGCYPITQISAASFRKIGRHLAQSVGHHRPRGVKPLREIARRPSLPPTPVSATSQRHPSSRGSLAPPARSNLGTTEIESRHSETPTCLRGQEPERQCTRHVGGDDGCRGSCRCCRCRCRCSRRCSCDLHHSCDARYVSLPSLDWADIVFYMCVGSAVTFLWF